MLGRSQLIKRRVDRWQQQMKNHRQYFQKNQGLIQAGKMLKSASDTFVNAQKGISPGGVYGGLASGIASNLKFLGTQIYNQYKQTGLSLGDAIKQTFKPPPDQVIQLKPGQKIKYKKNDNPWWKRDEDIVYKIHNGQKIQYVETINGQPVNLTRQQQRSFFEPRVMSRLYNNNKFSQPNLQKKKKQQPLRNQYGDLIQYTAARGLFN